MVHKTSFAGLAVLLFSLNSIGVAEDQPLVGPATEKRFPPLIVPAGFQAKLFACDPLVEYPSVISIGPKKGTLFVAHDYVTGLGIEIVRRDEIRLLEDTNGDGHADKSTVFAKGFNSIQGLAYSGGTVFAMHAPLLTAVRDKNGDGVADERTDLINGLGLPPEENSNRLHCANGVTAGHDGWLYLSLGDRGCDVQRKEGDRLVFRKGGMLRCRADGSDLHVFSGGLRNIYDIALDEELNVFTRDNENDGGDYMIRVCQSFHGADHGYPYLYYERSREAMAPLADLGRGSSAGGVCYRETAFPEEYRGNLFFCEWGRAVVRYPLRRSGGGFAPTQEIDFAAGSPGDPYGFKPTDIVVDYDGSLLVSDWCDGQRPKRGRGRIYRISYLGPSSSSPKKVRQESANRSTIQQLDSASYHQRLAAQQAIEKQGEAGVKSLQEHMKNDKVGYRGRMHAIWVLANTRGTGAVRDLMNSAETDSDPRVRAQAVRAIADLTDPILRNHQLTGGRGSANIAGRLKSLGQNADPRVVLEVIVALGRLSWADSPNWLKQHLIHQNPAILHAAQQTLRRANNWPQVLQLLDQPDTSGRAPSLRGIALRAIADQANQAVVDGLLNRLASEKQPHRRRDYVDALARVYKTPAPWVYWGFRPKPRPANSVSWSRTAAIEKSLQSALSDSDLSVRRSALEHMLREEIPVPTAALAQLLSEENDAERVAVIIEALKTRLPEKTSDLLEQIVQSPNRNDQNRLAAVAILTDLLKAEQGDRLLVMARDIDDGPVLAQLLGELGRRPKLDGNTLLLKKLHSQKAEVRAAAIGALAQRNSTDAAVRVPGLLLDESPIVRRAAALAAGELQVKSTGARLLVLSKQSDPDLQRAVLKSLWQLQNPNATDVAEAGLLHPKTQLVALRYLEDYGGLEQMEAVAGVARSSHSQESVSQAVACLARWKSKLEPLSPDHAKIEAAIAKIHGMTGTTIFWDVLESLPAVDADRTVKEVFNNKAAQNKWRTQLGTGDDAQLHFPKAKSGVANPVSLASSRVFVEQESRVGFFATGNGSLRVWLNGTRIFRRDKPASSRGNTSRFEAVLAAGLNQLVVEAAAAKANVFSLRFRQKSSKADHERLTGLALQDRGNVSRGREMFFKAEKSQCIKCHRIGGEGGQIGPDLSGIGRRFSRVHLVESILQPSRSMAPSYETIALALSDGRVLTGVKQQESETTIKIGDQKGKVHEIAKVDIEARRVEKLSTMPEGLEKNLTDREFVDLIAFLVSQKK